jgi:hypothetical protein
VEVVDENIDKSVKVVHEKIEKLAMQYKKIAHENID